MIASGNLLLAALLVLAAALPAKAEWIVDRVSPPADFALGGEWEPLRLGMVVTNRTWIHTGRRGRVLLRNSRGVIQIKPHTVAMVAAVDNRGAEDTSVLVKAGRVFLDLDRRGVGEVSVSSPFLAATVKGTRFDVGVRIDGAEVRVHRGVVRITHLAGGKQVDLRPSQRATVSASGLRLNGRGPFAPIIEVAPRTPRVQPPTRLRPQDGRAIRERIGRRRAPDDYEGARLRDRIIERLREERVDRIRPATPQNPKPRRDPPPGPRPEPASEPRPDPNPGPVPDPDPGGGDPAFEN